MSLVLAAVLAAAVGSVTATPGPQPFKQQSSMKASGLRDLCRPQRRVGLSDDPSQCRAYILGAVDSVRTIAVESGVEVFCTPRKVTADQLVGVFMGFLDRHPQYAINAAAGIVTLAMEDAYPCKPPRGGRR